MKIGIIDADLIGRKNHRFPNLASMKLSGWHKSKGDDVRLLLSYMEIYEYDRVYVSKAFTDTYVPEWVTQNENVQCGGTGFYFDKAPDLPCEIEHSMPDYELYAPFVNMRLKNGEKPKNLKWYTDYSIGYITRGCFRKCPFCVNQKYDRVHAASALSEFYDPKRKKICLLDDNFLGYSNWKTALNELKSTGKMFLFKQGLDERILTDDKCAELFSSKYDGEFKFAFDNLNDKQLIESKLRMIRRYTQNSVTFYVLCGFDYEGKYDEAFWRNDIDGIFQRIEVLGKYSAHPYIMRFEKYNDSPYKGLYITIARWANQTSYFKKESFREYVYVTDRNDGSTASARYFEKFEKAHPDIAGKWFDRKLYVPC